VPPWTGDPNSNGYDRYGNLLIIDGSKTRQGCLQTTLNVGVNGYNHVTNSGFTYDAAGNLMSDGVTAYVWDDEGRLSSAASTSYTYDGDGERVKKGSSVLYWYGGGATPLVETDSAGNNPVEYIFFGGARIARRDASANVTYYFSDQIGTTRTMTDSTGHLCYDADFYPFGGERTPYVNTCSQSYKFAGMERDSETQNDHTMFRYYASNTGRWLSPDPLGGDVTNPQSFNRYAYVLNNPTNLTDPSGLCPVYSIPGHCASTAGAMGSSGDGVGGWGEGWLDACGVDPFCIANGGVSPFDTPEAQVGCVEGHCFVGSYAFAQYNIGGTYSVDFKTQYAAAVAAAIESLTRKLNQAFAAAAEALHLKAGVAYYVWVRVAGLAPNITVYDPTSNWPYGCAAAPNVCQGQWGEKDPISIVHNGNPSWYNGGLFNAAHAVNLGDWGLEFHIDPFNPENGLAGAAGHILFDFIPYLANPHGPQGSVTCQVGVGCN
jgi:RHS repeat-associated protein